MPVEVNSSPRHPIVASIVGTSLTGDGLLVRLRSAMIGMLGMVAAVGLGLVAVISQIGWPSVVSGPIPDGPAPAVVRNDAIAPPPLALRGPRSAARARIAGRRGAANADGGPAPSLALATSHRAGPAPATPTPPAKPSPPSAGQSPATGESPPAQVAPPATAQPPAKKEPPAKEPSSPPATASDSPGHSGESHGGGPPPWAPAGSGGNGNGGGHGKPDWAGH
jgi:hypothetical protein